MHRDLIKSKVITNTGTHVFSLLEKLNFSTFHFHLHIKGMGAGLVPGVIDLDIIDEVVPVHSDDASKTTFDLWNIGLPVGISSGAIVNAALKVCERDESAGKFVVAIIPSFGERYFTHPMFAEIKEKAEGLVKQPLPEPFDNTDYGFATPRG